MEEVIKRLREINTVEVFYIRLEITISQPCSTRDLRGHIITLLRSVPGISVVAILCRPRLTIGDATMKLGFAVIVGMRRFKIIIKEARRECLTVRARCRQLS